MLSDARTVSSGTALDYDVCIVGAGAAGITVAVELMGTPVRVCLLESGGLVPDPATQQLYRGQSVGHAYYPLDVPRLRYSEAQRTTGPAIAGRSSEVIWKCARGSPRAAGP